MFIGHFVAAELLHDISPGTPTWVALAGVSFPDLLWGVTVLTGVEEVELDPASPLQSTIKFVKYPYSHSLVLGGAIACIPALVLALIFGPVAGLVFIVGSVSHWLLDTVVHLPDLPVLGFDGDRKVGLGLWRHGRIAMVAEYSFFAAGTIAFVPRASWTYVLIVGLALHLANVNSFLGLTKGNPIKSSRAYAVLAIVGFAVGIWLFRTAF
jgi:hypothetical protein